MTAYYNEYDPKAAAWLRELIRCGLIADGVVDERSILDVRPDDLIRFTQCHFFAGIGGWSFALRMAGWPDEKPVWTGSPPCQPFSAAGKQKGKEDERHLAPHFVDLVRASRPAMLLGEQVASSAVFGKPAKKSKQNSVPAPQWAWIDDLSDRLEAARYAVGAVDLPAAGFGAPHIRQRTFFGAVRMADDTGSGLEGTAREGLQGRSAGFALCDKLGGSNAPDAPWGDPDWLFCRDGKWRPVESGTFPLAHGVPARVGRLRGYGNAIVPQAAVEFISAFMDALR